MITKTTMQDIGDNSRHYFIDDQNSENHFDTQIKSKLFFRKLNVKRPGELTGQTYFTSNTLASMYIYM